MQNYLEKLRAQELPRVSSDLTMTCNVHHIYFDTILPECSLSHYASEYGLAHARGEPGIQLKASIISFLSTCPARWRTAWGVPYSLPQTAENLWIAAFFGPEQIYHELIEENGPSFTIQEAASQGLTGIGRVLMTSGADVNATDPRHGTVLRTASSRGKSDTVQLLLENGVTVTQKRPLSTCCVHCMQQHLSDIRRSSNYSWSTLVL
jgi:hypothetical protein